MSDDAIFSLCADGGASFMHYGGGATNDAPGTPVVETFGSLDFEYAAIRKGAAIRYQLI